MTTWPRRLLLPVIAAGLAGLTACSAPAPAAAPPADAATAHGGHGGEGAVELWAVQTGPLGIVVADATGHMLYRSDLDGNAPPVSRCEGPCTQTWEPFVAEPGMEPVLLGVDPADFGSLTRADGAVQYTLGGWPIYRRAGENAGLADAGANGTDGVWFALTPTGGKAVTP